MTLLFYTALAVFGVAFAVIAAIRIVAVAYFNWLSDPWQ